MFLALIILISLFFITLLLYIKTTPEHINTRTISEADLSSLTTEGIRALADYFISMFPEKNYVTSMKKTAIYAPKTLNFGLARMYSVFAFKSSQNIEIFSEREKAIQWLRNDK
jgi:hypothetical protein